MNPVFLNVLVTLNVLCVHRKHKSIWICFIMVCVSNSLVWLSPQKKHLLCK